jgi:uncharacterized protein YciI
MPSFALMCFDKPGALPIRVATREAHLAYLQSHKLDRYGGPLLDENDQACGSLIVIEVEDLAAARAFADNDPYAKAGLFERVEIRGLRPILGQY